jgi:hypothetical protein
MIQEKENEQQDEVDRMRRGREEVSDVDRFGKVTSRASSNLDTAFEWGDPGLTRKRVRARFGSQSQRALTASGSTRRTAGDSRTCANQIRGQSNASYASVT